MLGFCTFLCAAVAVSNLNANAITFEDVEQLRDRSVATAGILLGVALGSMLTEGVICAMRFCTKGGSIAFFVSGLIYFQLLLPLLVQRMYVKQLC